MSPPIDAAETDIAIRRNVEMRTRDGVVLRADVWRPADDMPRPAILVRTPYDKNAFANDFLRPLQAVQAGYAVVLQDTRGRFASDGDWAPAMWDKEATDTYDAVEWVAEQVWCDGNVGMAGPSYLAIVQWLGAQQVPPHLKAIAPALATFDELDKAETGGAFRLDHLVTWLAFMAADWLQRQIAAGNVVSPETVQAIVGLAMDPAAAMERLPLTDILDSEEFPVTMRSLLDGTAGSTPSVRYADIGVPVLMIGGWYDTFQGATFELFSGVRREGGSEQVRQEHRLIVGPWAHAGTLPSYQGELNFGVQASGLYSQLAAKTLRFFDRHLKGTGAPLVDVEYFLMGADAWRSARSWPPEGSTTVAWYLHSGGAARSADGDGTLDEQPPGDEPPDTYVYDPKDPVRTHGGRVLYLGKLVGGPFDQHHIEARDDVLCYTSSPLADAVDVVGPVAVSLWVTSSAPDTDFAVKLTDVHPDGRSVLVAEGYLRTRYRNGHDREELLRPGEREELTISLGHTAWRFMSGHRVRLDVTSSNFPQFDRNLNTGHAVGADDDGVAAIQTVFHAAAAASRLLLSVAPQEGARQ